MGKATEIVIVRGRYAPRFQVARAQLSAASATITTSPTRALDFVKDSIIELRALELDLTKQIQSMR